MLVCKDIGCLVNYCSLQKMDYVQTWEGSSDCQEEISDFNKCMVAERRRYSWMPREERPNLYDWAQKRIKERALEAKHKMITDDERSALQKLV